jgi:hypothetical protein
MRIDFAPDLQSRPDPVPLDTFDHTTELPSKLRLVARSNS